MKVRKGRIRENVVYRTTLTAKLYGGAGRGFQAETRKRTRTWQGRKWRNCENKANAGPGIVCCLCAKVGLAVLIFRTGISW